METTICGLSAYMWTSVIGWLQITCSVFGAMGLTAVLTSLDRNSGLDPGMTCAVVDHDGHCREINVVVSYGVFNN